MGIPGSDSKYDFKTSPATLIRALLDLSLPVFPALQLFPHFVVSTDKRHIQCVILFFEKQAKVEARAAFEHIGLHLPNAEAAVFMRAAEGFRQLANRKPTLVLFR